LQTAVQAALCSFTARIVGSVSRRDHRIGSKAEQATASVRSPVAVVVTQPVRICVARSGSATRIASRLDLVESMGRSLRDRLGPAGATSALVPRRLDDGQDETR
jgi:hypothetical protein